MKRLLIDLDGTLYRGDVPIPGARECIQALQAEKVPFLLFTNCPLNSPELLQEKLEKMGISVLPEQIMSSGSVCAQYLGEQYPQKTVFAVGSDSFTELLVREGLHMCRDANSHADVVAVGYAPSLDYEQLCCAGHQLRNGAAFVATNRDATIPRGSEIVPHTGAVVAYLEAASGKSPLVIGKPFSYMLTAALQHLQCKKEDCVVLGDGLDTDYAFAVHNGLDYRVILSGVTTGEMAIQRGVLPGKLYHTLSEAIASLHLEEGIEHENRHI